MLTVASYLGAAIVAYYLALFVVSGGIDWDELAANPERFDLPASVIQLLRGDLGTPAGGFPQPFTERALRGAHRALGFDVDPEMRVLQSVHG